MTCEDVRGGDLVERYLGGDLDEASRDRFEEHYFGCDDCFAALQAARAVQEEFPPSVRRPHGLLFAAAAAVVLLAAAGTAWMLTLRRENRDLQERLARASVQPEVARQAREIAQLRARLDQLSQPDLNAPIVDLEPDDTVRRGGAPAKTVAVADGARFVTFVLTAPADVKALGPPPYAVSIAGGDGRVVWQATGLEKSRFDTFTLTVPATLLPSGDAAIRVGRQRYDLRIVRR